MIFQEMAPFPPGGFPLWVPTLPCFSPLTFLGAERRGQLGRTPCLWSWQSSEGSLCPASGLRVELRTLENFTLFTRSEHWVEPCVT